MLASVAVLMLGFSLPERPWSVALTPHAGLTVVSRPPSSLSRLFVNGGATLELGFRPIPYLRVMALALGELHEAVPDSGFGGGGQVGLAAFMGGLEGLVPLELLEISAAVTLGGGWVDLRNCTSCHFGAYQNVMLVAPSLGLALRIEEHPWLNVGAVIRLLYLLSGEYALHFQFGLRVEARF